MIEKLKLRQPPNRTVKRFEDGAKAASEIGYPLVVRPSYVLGGRAMDIVYDDVELETYLRTAVSVSNEAPVLLDRFLDQAIEVDIDAVSDGKDVVIGAVMEHIEQAGVHSGDSACSLPPYSLSKDKLDEMRRQVHAMARELGVVGLMNVQLAIQNDDVFVLEVNPRASRTVPFVSKCIGTSLAKVAARCMVGKSLAEQGFTKEIVPDYYSVKEAVFPFGKFPGVDPILGPEMKSTGEVMGVGRTFGEAYGKAQIAAGEFTNDSEYIRAYSCRSGMPTRMPCLRLRKTSSRWASRWLPPGVLPGQSATPEWKSRWSTRCWKDTRTLSICSRTRISISSSTPPKASRPLRIRSQSGRLPSSKRSTTRPPWLVVGPAYRLCVTKMITWCPACSHSISGTQSGIPRTRSPRLLPPAFLTI